MSANDHQYALNWNNHTLHLKKAFDSLLARNEFVDVTLSCEGKKINAHKMLLSACSTYFHDLFRDNPCQHPIVIFKDVKFQNLVDLLAFMYSGEVSVPPENLDSFLKTAELLHISGLNGEQNRISESEHAEPCDTTKLFNHTRALLKRHAKVAQERTEVSTERGKDDANASEESTSKKPKEETDFSIITEIKQEQEEVLNTEPEEFTSDDPLSVDDMDLLETSGSQDFADIQDLLNVFRVDTGDIVIPADVTTEATESTFELLPAKSKERYEKEFKAFDDWRKEKGACNVTEMIVLEYFHNLGENFKPSTLWARYSMLRTTLNAFEQVDISRFQVLTRYLRDKGKGFKSKKAKKLQREHIGRFLVEAPDDQYLLLKMILIFGVAGGCNRDELCKLKLQNIEDKGSYLTVVLPDARTNKPRKFLLMNEGFDVNVLDIYKKYKSLRPKHVSHDRFFLCYRNSRCTIQPVGIHSVAKVPKQVATYLNLADPDQYNGHSLRRSSAPI